MKITLNYTVKGEQVDVTVQQDDNPPYYVTTSKFHYLLIGGVKGKAVNKCKRDEFVTDVTFQLNHLAATNFTYQDFSDAVIQAAAEHILKFKRIYLSDLWSYIDVCMNIMEATIGQFHSIYQTENEAILARNTIEENAKSFLHEYLIDNRPSVR